MEYLESTPNANAVDAEPILFAIFTGKWKYYSMGCVLSFILINHYASQVFSAPFSMTLSSFPAILLAIYVVFFVNGKLPHYTDDVCLTGIFYLLAFLYLRGWLKRPPQLWRKIPRQKPVV